MWKGIVLTIAILMVGETSEERIRYRRDVAFRPNILYIHPCYNESGYVTGAVRVEYLRGLPPGEENQYDLVFSDLNGEMYLMFDSEATLTLKEPISARIAPTSSMFILKFFKNVQQQAIKVKGPATGTIPYIKSVDTLNKHLCVNASTGYLDEAIQGFKNTAAISLTLPDSSCGRRKVTHTALIVNGLPTKPGDWPWHAALYRLDKSSLNYICGGTLISKTMVLTAAHCVTIRNDPVLPEIITVVLGKYNLAGGDIATQEKEVHEIIVNKEYDHKHNLENDIALLKLKTEVSYDDYVQPACLWHTDVHLKLPAGKVFGTVVGWGFNQTDKLSHQLQQTIIPQQSESNCIKSNPVFYSNVLTPKKFCAGLKNGTSACNGDSGGAFSVFVPDESGNSSPDATGAWYVKGIVSMTVSRKDAPICDPNYYVVFTDIEKYADWLKNYI